VLLTDTGKGTGHSPDILEDAFAVVQGERRSMLSDEVSDPVTSEVQVIALVTKTVPSPPGLRCDGDFEEFTSIAIQKGLNHGVTIPAVSSQKVAGARPPQAPRCFSGVYAQGSAVPDSKTTNTNRNFRFLRSKEHPTRRVGQEGAPL
jgi:hypothetical protein